MRPRRPATAGGLSARIVVRDRGVDVALDVAAGECVAVVGPNGAGKSTVVQALAGLLRQDDGDVCVGDRVLVRDGRTVVPAHRRGIGVVAQDPALFPHRSVLGNVVFGPRALGAGRRQARLRAVAALESVGAAAFAGRSPTTLSGGQAQRVAIARALATDPAVLLLDEPTSALDVTAQQEVRAALRSAAAGRATLLVTHDPVEAMVLADRVVVVEEGRVVEQGTVERVLGRPVSTFGAAFSGLVLLRGTATATGVALDASDGGGDLVSATRDVPPGLPVLAAYHPAAARLTRDDAGPESSGDGASGRAATDVGGGVRRRIVALEPRDGLVRVRCGDLVVDVSVATVRTLGLAPGDDVRIAVPPVEIAVYPPGGGMIDG